MNFTRILTSLNWFTVVLSPLAVILMEVFWVYPWLIWMGRWPALVSQRPPLSLLSVILIAAISFFVTRFFIGRKWSLRRIQLCIVSCALLVIFLVVRLEYGAGFGLFSGQWFVTIARFLLDSFSRPHPIVIALPAAAYLWWRGISRGRSTLYFDDIYFAFILGMVSQVLLIIVWRASSQTHSLSNLTSTLGLYIAGFFFFGLTALALGNLTSIRERMLERDETAPMLARHWLSILMGVVGGIVLISIGIASMFSPEFVAILVRLLNLGYLLLLRVLDIIFIPIGYLVAGLVYITQFMVSLFRRLQLLPSSSGNMTGLEPPPDIVPTHVLSPEAILAIKWGLFAVAVVLVVLLFVRAVFRRRTRRRKSDSEETDESLWSWDTFKADLRLFFGLLWRRIWPKRTKPVTPSHAPVWHPADDTQGPLSIREIYRNLLWEASSSRVTRKSHETPNEFALRLKQAIPDGSEQVEQLTSLYVGIRYGDRDVEAKQVARANSLWKVLKSLLARLGESPPLVKGD
ncbi:MAG: DUF4129 domain-containing protein [Chloroflexi bacterium]|nr:DUF4129 domain-containing protein [Chloroflexota bacterium]